MPKENEVEKSCEEVVKDLIATQLRSCDCETDGYFRGMVNGMIVINNCISKEQMEFVNYKKKKWTTKEITKILNSLGRKFRGREV